MIAFSCTHCGMKFKVKDEFARRSTRCPTCKHSLVVPDVPPMAIPVAAGQVEGSRGTLAYAGVQSDVTLDQASRAVLDKQHHASPSRYLIESEIARGGMGAVLRAIDSDIRREVALKYMLDPTSADKKARFVEEAQITGQLEHPNIVPIHELGIDSRQRLFFSMKMVRGQSLAEVLKEQRWTQGRLLTVLVNVCHALAFAHSRGVVHRDLKPANIMLGDFGEVYVMDWGLAKVLASRERQRPETSSISTSRSNEADLTQDGAILGTPVYMPPEQAMGQAHEVDERSDIYSLGAILYELLTDQPPIAREGGTMAILMRVAEGEIELPHKLTTRSVPPELSAIAMKALAREKKDRYPTVTAFREDIERYIEGRSVSAKQDTAWETFKKLVKRNKGVSVSTGIGALVLLVVTVLFLKANIQARLRAETAYEKHKEEQKAREKLTRASVPAFVRAARQAINEDRLDDAKALADSALGFDPDAAEARLIRAQLLIGQLKFEEATEELYTSLKTNSGLDEARKLLALVQETQAENGTSLSALATELTRQKLFPLANRLMKRVESLTQSREEMLTPYRNQLGAVWKGIKTKLTLDESDRLVLNLSYGGADLRDLSPLKGVPLNSLNLNGCTQLQDLSALKGMPLTVLNLKGTQVKDLGPLQGMKLNRLDLSQCKRVEDLTPLRDMPLTALYLELCREVKDLTPLKGRPLVELDLTNCVHVQDLSPLKGMPLEKLNLDGCGKVRDLTPLEGMPLTSLVLGKVMTDDLEPLRGMKKLASLDITGCIKVQKFDPLQGLPLTSLAAISTSLKDLTVLKGMKLTSLNLKQSRVSDLGPLRGMPLKMLDVSSCRFLNDLTPLQGMPLTDLRLNGCSQVTTLAPLKGMKLTKLQMQKCSQLVDLTPLEGMPLQEIWLEPGNITKGMEVLRKMMTLRKISTSEITSSTAEEFWKKYDAGKSKK